MRNLFATQNLWKIIQLVLKFCSSHATVSASVVVCSLTCDVTNFTTSWNIFYNFCGGPTDYLLNGCATLALRNSVGIRTVDLCVSKQAARGKLRMLTIGSREIDWAFLGIGMSVICRFGRFRALRNSKGIRMFGLCAANQTVPNNLRMRGKNKLCISGNCPMSVIRFCASAVQITSYLDNCTYGQSDLERSKFYWAFFVIQTCR